MDNSEVISIVDNLIETCRKGQDGFRKAAENVQNSEFRRLFNIISQQRTQFVSELQAEVHRLRGETVQDSDKTSAVPPALPGNTLPFRTSTTAKSAGMRDEVSVIAACQRQEEAAVDDYQEALKADLPLDVQYVVKRQYMDIKDTYDRIRILQRAA